MVPLKNIQGSKSKESVKVNCLLKGFSQIGTPIRKDGLGDKGIGHHNFLDERVEKTSEIQ